jgi:hypothetical protein
MPLFWPIPHHRFAGHLKVDDGKRTPMAPLSICPSKLLCCDLLALRNRACCIHVDKVSQSEGTNGQLECDRQSVAFIIAH